MSDECECCTCGYKWVTGKSGHHICSEYLLKKISDLQKELNDYKEVDEDVQRLSREVGVALGYDAKQPSLCDLVKVAEQLQKDNTYHIGKMMDAVMDAVKYVDRFSSINYEEKRGYKYAQQKLSEYAQSLTPNTEGDDSES